MKIDRQELLGVLELLQPGLLAGGKDSAAAFVFHAGRIWTHNDLVAVSHPTDPDLECTVWARELSDLLKKLPTAEVEAELTDSELRLRSGRSRAGIRLAAEDAERALVPIRELELPASWAPLPGGFRRALSLAVPCVGRDMSRQSLTAVHAAGGFVEACDNYRATRAFLDGDLGGDLLVPGAAAKELSAYDFAEWGPSDGWAHFRTAEGVSFSCRVMEGEYPDLSPYLAAEGRRVKFPSGLEEILERAAVFTEGELAKDRTVEVGLEANRCRLRGEGPAGWYEEETKAKWGGEPATFHVNPGWLKEVVGQVRSCVVVEGRRLVFEADGWTHMVLLSAGKR